MTLLLLFIAFAAGLLVLGIRLATAGGKRAAEAVVALGLLVAVFGVNAWHQRDKKAAAEKLSATLVVLEDRLKEGDTAAALGILDRGIRLFASS